jgi:hypothetical protein
MFPCKNDEHRTLGNIYFIPHHTANIVSYGQLDEIGFQIVVHGGAMCVRDDNMRMLAKINHDSCRLYVLGIELPQPVCLAAIVGKDAWRWHAQFGHVNFGALQNMAREELMCGLSLLS